MEVRKKKLTKKQLAEHRGWRSASQLSKPRFRDMPDFHSFESFDIWYDGQRTKGSRSLSETTSIGDKNFQDPPRDDGSMVDVAKFIRKGDHDELTIQDAEQAVQISYGLLMESYESGNPAKIAAALKNWSEATKQGSSTREAYLKILTARKSLVDLDLAFGIFGPVLSEVRNFIARFGASCCKSANPENPELALRVMDKHADRFLERIAGTEESLRLTVEQDAS